MKMMQTINNLKMLKNKAFCAPGLKCLTFRVALPQGIFFAKYVSFCLFESK